MRRVEDKIRRLCTQILAAEEEDGDLAPMLVELRDALHQHIERLRAKLGNYPFLLERRVSESNSAAGYPPSREVSSKSAPKA
jgi:hypothetical protein